MPTTDFDSLFSDWDTDSTVKTAKRTATVGAGCFGLYFVLAVLASLALTGVVIWAIIMLVNHFT